MSENVMWFDALGMGDVDLVGGKNASLGEMYRELAGCGVRVPNGFATTAGAFRRFLSAGGLDERITELIAGWDRDDVSDLEERTRRIRSLVLAATLPADLRDEIAEAYRQLSRQAGVDEAHCAVRSSATAEDLPEASFAGQQETYLMVHGHADVIDAVRRCFASLFTARAVSYREDMGIGQDEVALSACVQRMVRSDMASSGVAFTLDTDSGHRGVVYLTGVWGLGENIVQGRVTPDAYVVHKDRLAAGFRPIVSRTIGSKELTMVYDSAANRVVNRPTAAELRTQPCLTDDEILQLAGWAVEIEDHYSERRGSAMPMDIEWAKDGFTGELFIVQARPETVHSRRPAGRLEMFERLGDGVVAIEGLAVGDRIASGAVRRIDDTAHMADLREGDVLVTEVTDPDWEPVLTRASALVTERGGRTSHAAIVARELSIPAVVGTGPVGDRLHDGQEVTVSCADGVRGVVYDGRVPFRVTELDAEGLPRTDTDVMLNVADPSQALKHGRLPSGGVGLARMEFIFAGHVGVHPMALLRPAELPASVRLEIDRITAGFADPCEFLVHSVADSVGTIAAAFWPRPVIVRFSDFKTNEYANLLGGRRFEPVESNPMIGWRGASRYHHPDYREGFELEVAALCRVREEMGLTNVDVMVPFCRTPAEGEAVKDVLRACGLIGGNDGPSVYVMAELPANVLQADEFAAIFDGFSIGSNDLTQLVLGVDRDSATIANLFDEQNPAVKRACTMVIEAARAAGRSVGICGQAPSDHPEFAAFLVREGIDSISVTPDALAATILAVAEAEAAFVPA